MHNRLPDLEEAALASSTHNILTASMILAALAVNTNGSVAAGRRPPMKLQAIPFNQVRITDKFWAPRMETNRKVTVSYSLDMLEKTQTMHNFDLAAAGSTQGYVGPPFADSDAYKAIEAASYALATHPDAELGQRLDSMVGRIAAAQQKDGYLNTYFQVQEPGKRWTNLRVMHELYCAGHLMEAAVAHYQATGKHSLLDVAARVADHIDSVFGDGPGKRIGYPGHPEIELALVKLWRVTGEKRYFDLARFFIENRGKGYLANEPRVDWDNMSADYFQDNVPINDHNAIVGHAVRAAYLFSGAVDVAAVTGDRGLLNMLDRVWQNTVTKRMYITGGIGPSASNEGFTVDYDLPNRTAYQETCASVAMAMWNQRLGLLYGDSKYIDVMETALYNGALAGYSLDGKHFFYSNPLSSKGDVERSEWFGCACCPPNISRTVASIGGYAYATSDDALWVNLYIRSEVKAKVGEHALRMSVKTDYPWSGKIRLTVNPSGAARFGLRLRVPGWCAGPSLKVNGSTVEPRIENGYISIDREWLPGDIVQLDLPMEIQRIEANPLVKEDAGRVALRRGPVIYCLEGCDQSVPMDLIALPQSSKLRAVRKPGILGGTTVLTGTGAIAEEKDWAGSLYQPAAQERPVTITAIPYALWCNRGLHKMEVWIPTSTPPNSPKEMEISASFQSTLSDLEAIYDDAKPRDSAERPEKLFHWWPNKGGEEWAQYEWHKPVTAYSARVYWFDDTGIGECRVPESWQILYKSGDEWKPVEVRSAYPIARDQWCEVEFAPVTTTALRLSAKLQPGLSSGVHEWKVQLR